MEIMKISLSNPRSILLFIVFASLFVLASVAFPAKTYAGATDTSDGCPVGQVPQTFVDSSGLGQSTNCVLIAQAGAPVASVSTLASADQTPTAPACTASVFSWSAFFNPSCWGPLLAGIISGALVYVTSSILAVAGVLFNWVFYETVLQFGQLINCGTSSTSCNPGIINGINLVWTAFRD